MTVVVVAAAWVAICVGWSTLCSLHERRMRQRYAGSMLARFDSESIS